jgi:aminopeptidase N
MLCRRAPGSTAPGSTAPGRAVIFTALVTASLALAILPLPAAATASRGSMPPTGVAAAPAATQVIPGSVNRTSLAITAEYDVDARLGVAARSLRGRVTITARNDSGGGIDRLELNTVMGPLGALRLGTVTVDGAAVAARLDDQTIIVPLGGVLPADATAVVVVTFSATLRSSTTGSNWLFTRANGIVDLYRWIPWVSRRTPFDRPNHGDPFVTPVSPRVTLRLRTDARLRVVSTGDRTAISADGLDMTFTAVNVRDLVVAAAADYRTTQVLVGDTVVRVAARPGFPSAAAMRGAKAAVAKLETRLGPYPYRVLWIVQTAGGFGMEGPGVAWIPTGVGAANLAYLVTHEIAHQWFYGLVGSDQAREPFADEAPADFVTRDILGMRRASRCAAADLDRSIYRYSNACYYEIVYIQGGNLLAAARTKMGSTAFWDAIRRYLADNRWGLVHTRTLLDALDSATSRDMGAWWDHRFPRLY